MAEVDTTNLIMIIISWNWYIWWYQWCWWYWIWRGLWWWLWCWYWGSPQMSIWHFHSQIRHFHFQGPPELPHPPPPPRGKAPCQTQPHFCQASIIEKLVCDFIMIIWWFYVWWTYICINEWWLHYDDSWWLTGNLTETTWSRSCSSTEWILSHHCHSISEKYSARITNGVGQPVFPSEWQSLVQIKPLEVEACQWDWNLP